MTTWRDREEFRMCVRQWADKLGIQVRSLYLRPMKNKWASCSTAGNLNFNVDLLLMERELGDYVIVHELLHFVVPNHGRLWKSLMRVHLGRYEQLEARLKLSVNRQPSASPDKRPSIARRKTAKHEAQLRGVCEQRIYKISK
jgi:predicted metal-dependent hydrolase